MNTETDHIVAALDALLTAYRTELDRKASLDEAAPAVGVLEWGDPGVTTAKLMAHSIIADPVGQALTMAMETLGRRLHEIGGMAAMSDALVAVCEAAPDQAYWREGYLDRRWSGIGSWMA